MPPIGAIPSRRWTAHSSPAVLGLGGLRSVAHNGEIYVIGYRGPAFWRYSPQLDRWTPLADPPYPVAGCAMELYNGKIYCVGGSANGGPGVANDVYQSVISYDIVSDTWTTENLRISGRRVWMGSAVVEDQFYVFGGFDSLGLAVDIVDTLITSAPVGIGDGQWPSLPAEFMLRQNYPNPFNPVTTIGFSLPAAGRVTLEIFDVLGRRIVAAYRNTPLAAGWHEFTWNGVNEAGQPVPSGFYLYRLTHTPFEGGDAQRRGMSQTRRMLLVR